MTQALNTLEGMLIALRSIQITSAYNNTGNMIGQYNHVLETEDEYEKNRQDLINRLIGRIIRYKKEYWDLIEQSSDRIMSDPKYLFEIQGMNDEQKALFLEHVRDLENKYTNEALEQATQILLDDYLVVLAYSGIDPSINYKLTI